MNEQEVDAFLEHHGIKGQKWGIRRDPQTGIRPIARTLNKSGFGRLSRANVNRHNSARRRHRDRRIAKLDTRINRSLRVANGEATVGDILRVSGNQSIISLIRGGGLKGAAANDAARLSIRRKRLAQGQRKVQDMLATHRGPVLFNLGGSGA